MSTNLHQLGRIQELIDRLAARLAESERQRASLQQKLEKLEAELASFSEKPLKNTEEIRKKIDTYLKDIDICLEKLNGHSQAGPK